MKIMSLSFPLSRKLLTRFQEVTASWEVGSDIWEVGGGTLGGGRSDFLGREVQSAFNQGCWHTLDRACKSVKAQICENSLVALQV